MKIIVVSDTHGSKDALRRIMELNSGADAVVHCGDSRGEMEEIKMRYPGKQYYEVRGNCDIGSALPQTLTFELDGFRYMVTHGHAYNVKYGLDRLFYAAKEAGVDAVLHTALDETVEGIRLINPGACGGINASFAVIETKNGQMLTNIAHLSRDRK